MLIVKFTEMKFRQRKKAASGTEWSDLFTILNIRSDASTITFTCKAEMHLEVNNTEANYTILRDWINSCNTEGLTLKINTKFLDIEVSLEHDENVGYIHDLEKVITSQETSLISLKSSDCNKNIDEENWDALLASAEELLIRSVQNRNDIESNIDAWQSRQEEASKLGFQDLALEAELNKRKHEELRDQESTRIQLIMEEVEKIKRRLQLKKNKSNALASTPIIDSSKQSNRIVEEVLSEINSMIGLRNIKDEIRSLINSIQVNQMRSEVGLPCVNVSNHMVFYGNPGTGKTTIARKLGELFQILGILSRGHFVETDRSGLVGGYLGQTAIKTTQVLESALGGILFIDEAYSFSQTDSSDQYGQEAIDTILKFMEDHREDLIVIVAGYKNPMSKFLQSNPGLKSRFNKYLSFNDYTRHELKEIFMLLAQQSNYELATDAEGHLDKIIEEMERIKSENFANGRAVRNLFEKTITNQANRIIENKISIKEELQRLTSEDILWEDMHEVVR